MDDIVFLSAKSLAAMIREKKISSEEVIKAHIQQIERVNPKINAVVQFYKEEALEKARKADIALSLNKKTGPLHGVPFTVKDYFEVKNAIITGGTTGLKANLCKENATLVKKLLKAGAILLGVTNAPEMGLAYESDNYIYGRTNSRWKLWRRSRNHCFRGFTARIRK
jgi:Asp-tRNA(Asn)/Glu-tRNA(Gln) amidotransferase A subunit family amidase